MEFLGVGYQELLLIMVLLLVVVGPERLPAVAYQIGRVVRQAQRYARAVRDEFSDEISYLEEQYKTVKGEVDTARDSVRATSAAFDAQIREAVPPAIDLPTLTPPVTNGAGPTNGATRHTESETKEPEAAPPAPPLVF